MADWTVVMMVDHWVALSADSLADTMAVPSAGRTADLTVAKRAGP